MRTETKIETVEIVLNKFVISKAFTYKNKTK